MNEKIDYKIQDILKQEINESIIVQLFYEIGEILYHNKVSYYELAILDGFLRDKYGLVIALSKKNLVRMRKFYQMSQNININILNKIDWNSYILLINKKNYENLIKVCVNQKLNKRELEYYLKTGKIMRISMAYRDPATEEFIKLQIRLNKKDI